MSLERASREVLSHYSPPARSLRPLGNHGGFSGAALWRVETPAGDYCLKAYPPGESSAGRLNDIHALMTRARRAGLAFVPAACGPAVEYGGRVWELVTWMPGAADLDEPPSAARVEAACSALARLHEAWAPAGPGLAVCPAVTRRLERRREWGQLVREGWRPDLSGAPFDPVAPYAERLWRLLPAWMEWVPEVLAPWRARLVPLRPCLCDVWRAHVLFEGEHVSGLVDFGGARADHPAADLARLLGSYCGDDEALWQRGLNAYAAVRPLTADEAALARVLDRTGILLAAAHWLRRLYHERRTYDDRQEVARRVARIADRAGAWRDRP